MTPEEALKNIGHWISNETRQRKYDKVTVIKLSDSLITLKDAVNQQVPKKPRYYIDNWGHNRPGCPGCPRNEILYAGQKYCNVCGTKIDWSDE